MSSVRINNLTKRFDGKPPSLAIDDLSLAIEEGEFLVLLGPSGCGKTTTLRCIAGLETANEGSITLGHNVVFDGATRVNKTPDKRDIGMVFQSYALWPHLTVRQNIAFPLKVRKIRQGMRDGWVEATAAMVDCSSLLDRYPAQLSGGQQQRVALARGLVAKPQLVLFDEPLSNLDAKLRDQVRTEIAELHNRQPFTSIYVTHDQSEALALGSRVAIMRSGAIEQLDTPREVFARPCSEYVADFIGMANRMELHQVEGAWRLGDQALQGAVTPAVAALERMVVRLRTDDVEVTAKDQPLRPGRLSLVGEVLVASFGGRHLDIAVQVGEHRFQSQMAIRDVHDDLQAGTAVQLSFDPSHVVAYDADGARVDAFQAVREGGA